MSKVVGEPRRRHQRHMTHAEMARERAALLAHARRSRPLPSAAAAAFEAAVARHPLSVAYGIDARGPWAQIGDERMRAASVIEAVMVALQAWEKPNG